MKAMWPLGCFAALTQDVSTPLSLLPATNKHKACRHQAPTNDCDAVDVKSPVVDEPQQLHIDYELSCEKNNNFVK